MRRTKYVTKIIMPTEKPIPKVTHDTFIVNFACSSGTILETIPPVADATITHTTGNNLKALYPFNSFVCRVN